MRINEKLFSSFYVIGKHLIPIIILILYSFLGGWIFMHLEAPYYSKTEASNASSVGTNNTAHDKWKILYEKLVDDLKKLVKDYSDKKNDGGMFVAKTSSDTDGSVSERKTFDSKNKTINETSIFYDDNVSKETFSLEKVILKLIKEYNTESDSLSLNDDTSSHSNPKHLMSNENPWNVWDATLYAASLYTTIGMKCFSSFMKLDIFCMHCSI